MSQIAITRIARDFTLCLLRGYKWAISPLLPPACRYVPTCSDYAMEAVDRYGALRGVLTAIGRVLRCHPFAKGGYDPVVKSAVVESKDYVTPGSSPHASCAVTE
jgi:putative membrane protein insertion efficiency factor